MNLGDIPTVIWGAIIGAAATVAASIIAGAVALIGQWRQAKLDGKSLESISSNTGAMKPKVDNIDDAIKDISKDVTKIEDRSRQINSIATAVESFKYLKDHANGNAIKPEEMLAQMSNVFEERAKLKIQHQNDLAKIAALTEQNRSFQARIQFLTQELECERQVNNQNSQYQDRDYGPELTL